VQGNRDDDGIADLQEMTLERTGHLHGKPSSGDTPSFELQESDDIEEDIALQKG
jgi:hypothetical protein